MRILSFTVLGTMLLASSWVTFYYLSASNLSVPGPSWLLLRPATSAASKHYAEVGPTELADVARDSDAQSEFTLVSLSSPAETTQNTLPPANRVVTSNGTVLFVHECRQIDSTRYRPQLVSLRFQGEGENPLDSVCISNSWWHENSQCSEIGQTFTPQVAADPGSKLLAGRVYCVWADGNSDQGQKIFFSASPDHGANWSQPAILSDYSDEKKSRNELSSFRPSIAVNHQGVVAVSWFQRCNSSDDEAEDWQLQFRASLDGGESWLDSVQVDKADATHASGITATPDGIFHPVWLDSQSSASRLQTAAVVVKTRM